MRRVIICLALAFAAGAVTSASPVKLLVHPEPNRDFTERMNWALRTASDDGFWIAYSIERPMPPGIFFNGDWSWHSHRGVPLSTLLSDGTAPGRLAIVLGYPDSDSPPDRVSVTSFDVPFDWRGRQVLWLGEASIPKSLEWLIQLDRASRSESFHRDDFREDLMDAVGLHDLPAATDFLAVVLASQAGASLREEAAEALAWQTDPRVVGLLVQTVENDRTISVRCEAVETLGEVEDDRAIEALIGFARSAEYRDVRAEAIEALGDKTLGNESLDENGSDRVIAVLEDILRRDDDVRIQDEALESLADLPRERSLPILIETARHHPRAEIREEAIEYLAEIAAEQAVSVLEEVASNDPSFAVRSEALEILAELPGGTGLPFVLKVARTHPDETLRTEAIEALADSGDPRARRALQSWAAE